MTLKIDIMKALDIVHWKFLLKFLQRFDINPILRSLIHTILQSSMIFICVNGKMQVFPF